MDQPSFSVCIPNYNYEHYLGETIRSVLNQTYPNFEIVVVDNASTDHSVEVVTSFHSDRIRLFQNQYNVGFAPNLDRAASVAQYPFILMLSSDDLMRPSALEEYAHVLLKLGEQAEHSLLVSSVDIIDSQGTITGRLDRKNYYSIDPDSQMTTLLKDDQIEVFQGLHVFKATYPRMSVPGHFCTTVFSRKLYEQVGGYSSIHPIGPDAHLDYKILLQNARVVFINRPLFAYRIHNTNQTAISRKNQTLKVPINSYLFSIQYSDQELSSAGVERNEMVHFLVDGTCLKGGLEELRLGSSRQAFRYLMFALASSPGMTMYNPKAYALAGLLCLGPLGPSVARLLYRIYKNIQ